MIYTKTEKARIETLLTVFREFISTHHYFDIGYAEKIGYIHIHLDNDQEILDCMAMRNYSDVLLVLFEEVSDDIRNERVRNGDESYCLYPSEVEAIKNFLGPIFEALPNKEDQEYCRFKLDDYLREYLMGSNVQ